LKDLINDCHITVTGTDDLVAPAAGTTGKALPEPKAMNTNQQPETTRTVFPEALKRSPTPTLQLDAAGRVLETNAAWERLVAGRQDAGLLPLIDPIDLPKVQAAIADACTRQTASEAACRLLLPQPRDMALVLVPDGPEQAMAVLVARHVAVADLEMDLLRRQLAGLMTLTSEAILLIDRRMVVSGVNRGAEEIFGYSPEEMIGRHVESLMPERYRSGHQASVDGFAGGDRSSRLMSERSTVYGLRKNGEEFPAEASITRSGSGEAVSFTVVLRDVTERRRVEAELSAAKRAAESANMAKSMFLATMSHELRTPLNAIIGFAEIIANQLFGDAPERYAGYAKDIQGSGQHLLSIIDEILDLSRIEVGAENLKFEWVQPAALVADSLLLVRHRAGNSGIVLSSEIAEDVQPVMLDRRRMRQVIVNLLTNAVKFTPRGGRVHVGVCKRGVELEIAVCDTGIGIPPEQLAKVFEPFHQVAGHRSRNPEGTGLGLSIARRICDSHGGRLTAESEVGGGTCMRILLPLGNDRTAAVQ
jgi:PAS domain S-box-containing protein